MSVFPSDLTEDQQALINVVWAAFRASTDQRWPIFEYVEAMLDKQDRDAVAILATFPTIGIGVSGAPSYGVVRPVYSGGKAPQPNQPLPLTIAGLAYVPDASRVVGSFFKMLDLMVETRRKATFDPNTPTSVVVTDVTFGRYSGLDPVSLTIVAKVAETEPPTWFNAAQPQGASWAREVRREIKHFANVQSVPDYLARIAAYLQRPEPQPEPRYASPFELGASLDYLNAIWMLHFGKKRPLLRYFSAERAGKIGLDAGTQEEYDSRLTALGEILKNIDVPSTPGKDGHPLERLPTFIMDKVPGANRERIDRAVEALNVIRLLRNAGQHADGLVDAAGRLPQLGLTFPITDWSAAWNAISIAAIDAVDTLRDEINVLIEDDETPST